MVTLARSSSRTSEQMINRPGRLADLNSGRPVLELVLGTNPLHFVDVNFDPMKHVLVFARINDNCKCPFTYLYRKGNGLWAECKKYACMDNSYDCNNKYINTNSFKSTRIGTSGSSGETPPRLHGVMLI